MSFTTWYSFEELVAELAAALMNPVCSEGYLYSAPTAGKAPILDWEEPRGQPGGAGQSRLEMARRFGAFAVWSLIGAVRGGLTLRITGAGQGCSNETEA